jgi:hypothetical protein
VPLTRWARSAQVATGSIGLVVALTGCPASPGPAGTTGASSAAPPSESGRPAVLSTAGLVDAEQPDGARVRWTTTWRACFATHPEDTDPAVGWEARVGTSEGSSPQVDELPSACVELDVATGTDADRRGRAVQLADAQALTYQVRAVHADGTVTPWSEPVRVGTQSSGG